jgi:hypothetical protein
MPDSVCAIIHRHLLAASVCYQRHHSNTRPRRSSLYADSHNKLSLRCLPLCLTQNPHSAALQYPRQGRHLSSSSTQPSWLHNYSKCCLLAFSFPATIPLLTHDKLSQCKFAANSDNCKMSAEYNYSASGLVSGLHNLKHYNSSLREVTDLQIAFAFSRKLRTSLVNQFLSCSLVADRQHFRSK